MHANQLPLHLMASTGIAQGMKLKNTNQLWTMRPTPAVPEPCDTVLHLPLSRRVFKKIQNNYFLNFQCLQIQDFRQVKIRSKKKTQKRAEPRSVLIAGFGTTGLFHQEKQQGKDCHDQDKQVQGATVTLSTCHVAVLFVWVVFWFVWFVFLCFCVSVFCLFLVFWFFVSFCALVMTL